MNYKNSKIYMILPTLEQYDEGDIYIGSTTDKLHRRLSYHRNNPFNLKTRKCRSAILVEKYGKDNLKIELICEFPCNNKYELRNREGQEIRNRKCVNKRIEGRDRATYRADNRQILLAKQLEYLKTEGGLRYLARQKEKVKCECCGLSVSRSFLNKHKLKH